jgi:glutathione synthase/RimK-type ligase-like ATP-grasp enzyme
MLTLLWGLPTDSPLARVRDQLERLGAPVWLLDQRDVLDTEIELAADRLSGGGTTGGWVRVGDRRLDLALVTAAYVRPHDVRRLPEVAAAGPRGAAWRHAVTVEDTLACCLELTRALVVNRPSAMAGNGSKPWQLRRVEAAGFAVPETLVTTDPAVAADFLARHAQVVYKSVSGVRSRVARLGRADTSRLADVATCPTQLQRYVTGTDVRAHVVGLDVFATEVRCDADDYRYAVEQGRARPELSATVLPDHVERRCRRLAADLGLAVAGIDLRRMPDGEWYCFEANPSPAFTFYERATGQPIARAVAALLAAAGIVHDHSFGHGYQAGAPRRAPAPAPSAPCPGGS